MKYIKILGLGLALAASATALTGCNDADDPDTSYSVITTGNTTLNDFDKWLRANFNEPYNIDFKYRYEDIEGDFNYYLVPARYEDAITMAHLVKYLCVETYNEVAGLDFTRRYFPKMFFTVGEWEYKNNGSFILGTAEGGRKIFLAGLNYLPKYLNDIEILNEFYFHTVHHEFTHILNQTYPMPTDFKTITYDTYVADMCFQSPYDVGYLTRGYVTAYAQTSDTEDFAEVMSVYITRDEDYWAKEIIAKAGSTGAAYINQKLEIVRNYLHDAFNIDIDVLRDVIQRRQADVVNGKVDLNDLTIL